MDMDDIGRDVAQRLAQLTSTAITLAQQMQTRREHRARGQAQQAESSSDELRRRLAAGGEAHRDQWERTAARGEATASSDRDLAAQWVSAAAWERHDPQATAARQVLDQELTRAGVPQPQLDGIRADPDFTDAAATLTNQQDQARRTGRNATGMLAGEIAQDRAEDTIRAVDSTRATRNVYARGAPPARLAGMAYPDTTEQAVGQAHQGKPPRSAARDAGPDRPREHQRGR